MVLIDTSAWVEYIRGEKTELCHKIDSALDSQLVAIGDLIYCEVLQGIYNVKQREEVRELLLSLPQFEMVGFDMAEKASTNYRRLRERGITIRKTIDVLIGTFCAEHDIALIHDDRDFENMKAVVKLTTL